MAIREQIVLDLRNPSQFVNVRVQQGDHITHQIEATITLDGEIYDIPDNTNAYISMLKLENKPVFNPCMIENNTVTFNITKQMSRMAGRQPAQIEFINITTGGVVKTLKFHLLVEEAAVPEEMIVNTSELGALTDALVRVEDVAQTMGSNLIMVENANRAEQQRITNESKRIQDENTRNQKESLRWNYRTLTKAQYDALPLAEKHDPKIVYEIIGTENEFPNELADLINRTENAARVAEGLIVNKAGINDFIPTNTEAFSGYKTQVKFNELDIKNNEIMSQLRQKASEEEVDIERKRINLLQANPGSTTADAALNDITIGFDGVVRDTPGESVRGQFNTIKNDLERYEQVKYPNHLFVQGAIYGDGAFVASTKSYVWKDWQSIKSGVPYICTFRDDLGYRVTANHRIAESGNRDNRTIQNGVPFIICFDNEHKTKLRLTKVDQANTQLDVTTEDITTSELLFKEYDESLFYANAGSAKSWNYINTLKKGEKIVCVMTNAKNGVLRLDTNHVYNVDSTNMTVVFDNVTGESVVSEEITLQNDIRSLRIYSNGTNSQVLIYKSKEYKYYMKRFDEQVLTLETHVQGLGLEVQDLETRIQTNGKNTEVMALTFANYGFDGAGNDGATYNAKIARTQKMTKPGYYLITFPDELKATYNVIKYENSTGRRNITSFHPFAMFNEGFVRVYFERKDGGNLLIGDALLNQVKIYRVNSSRYNHDIVIAPSDANEYKKAKADIVLSGTDDTRILAAVFGSYHTVNALLYGGTYHITEMWTYSPTAKISLPFNGYNYDGGSSYRRYINISGESPSTPQCYDGVKFYVSQALHDSLATTGMYYFIVGTPYSIGDKIGRMATTANLKNFNIIGYKYDKPITYIDTTRCLSTMIESVNVRSWQKSIATYDAFEETPNLECCGLRVGRGSNYGIQNYVKNSNYWYCGKGVACNGEHFIFEDVKTHHDYIGFVFGDRNTVGRVEHPNILIGCSIESCYRLMWLSKMGVTTERDFVVDYDNYMQHNTLIVIGLSTETRWSIPVNERIGELDSQKTLPILEILRGCHRGRIELDGYTPSQAFESGSGTGMTVTNYV